MFKAIDFLLCTFFGLHPASFEMQVLIIIPFSVFLIPIISSFFKKIN